MTSCAAYAACGQICGSKDLCVVSNTIIECVSESFRLELVLAASREVTIGMHDESRDSVALNV